jgi:HAE1 family hydrophobic/amphiphilic exporter-1
VLATGLVRGELGLGALLGGLVIVGVYSRSVLALFDRYRELTPQRGLPPSAEAVVAGARERFLPVSTVTIAVAALLIPAAVMGTRSGLELLNPIAIFTLGGLLTTAAMILIFIPLAFARIVPDNDPAQVNDLGDTPAELAPRTVSEPSVAAGSPTAVAGR